MAAYNLSQLRILWEIGTDGLKYNIFGAGTSPSIPGDFSILNAKSDIVEQVYRTSNIATCYIQMDCGVPDDNLIGVVEQKAIVVDTFALLNHNLTQNAVIKLYGYGNEGTMPPSTPAQFLASSPELIFTASPNVDLLETNFIWVSPIQRIQKYRHYLIVITDSANPDGYIQIGRILGGEATIFTTDENFTANFTYQEVSYKDTSEVNGFTSVSNARSLKKKMTAEFINLNAIPTGSSGLNYRNFKRYARYCRDTLKALVIPDSRIPYMFHLYAKMIEVPSEKFNFLDMDALYVSMTVDWDEAK